MISKISGMRQAQLQNSFVSDNNDLSQWQYIIFSDAENMNKKAVVLQINTCRATAFLRKWDFKSQL